MRGQGSAAPPSPTPPCRVRLVASGRDLRRFIALPEALHRGDPSWVPPLRREVARLLSLRHPFYENAERALFLCLRGDRAVGRIAAIHNRRHNQFHRDRAGFFGFFECAPDTEAASALLGTAEAWLRERGLDRCRGPVNPSTNEECGLLLDNFTSPPFVMTTYNPPYYAGLLEGAGYAKAKDLFSYFFEVGRRLPGRLERLAARVREREPGLTVRPVDLADFGREVGFIKTIYNEAWERNWGFVPMTEAEMDHMAKRLRPLVVPDMVVLAFVDGEPAGFLMALPDYNQVLRILGGRLGPLRIVRAALASRRLRNVRVLTLGVRERFRRRGLEAPLFEYAWGRGIERGDLYGEFSWILEDNQLVNETAVKVFGATRYKTHRIYEKEIPRAL